MSELPTELVPLSPEQRDIVDLTRSFAQEEIRPRARAVDEADTRRSGTCGARPPRSASPDSCCLPSTAGAVSPTSSHRFSSRRSCASATWA